MNDRTPIPAEFGGPAQPQAQAQTPAAALGQGASDKQLKWLRDLAETREMPEEARTQLLDRLAVQEQANAERGDRAPVEGGISLKRAGDFITRLKDRPRRPREQASGEQGGKVSVEYIEVPGVEGRVEKVGRLRLAGVETPILPGSYGVPTPEESFTNDTTFFKVWINAEFGKGWGVKMYVSDDTDKVKIAYPTQVTALEKIVQDPAAAAALFGHEFKRCGVCGRGLTNDESRALGIGPVCRRRLDIGY